MSSVWVKRMVKGSLLLLHTFYWTCGLFLIFLSLWSLLDPSRGPVLSLIAAAGEDLLKLVCFCQFLSGSLVLAVGVSGTFGAVRESRGWMALFISLLLLLLTLEGLICVLGLLYQPSIYISLRTVLQQRMIQDYGREGYEAFTEAIDFTQYKFSCCGVVSPTDYQNSVTTRWRWALLHPSSESRLEVPRTCCKLLNEKAYRAWQFPQAENHSACQSISIRLRGGNRFTEGCFEKVQRWLISQNILAMLFTGGVMAAQVFSIFLTLCMCRNLDKRVHGQFV